ncbi:phosphate ABC transporter substrate-binding/OmpA family protein [Rheinheimera sp.]|uniref:phosphate ABC transporter substrate-binding/OmpA family protein n=1 Tax=Rheinheimera sp. TaxID=1869214 RepID=UPI00273728DF|nr:phosphate ABC transporter substrate-binding/OmpA family protein [Rheinheimera sp.]MDP2714134.1 phosphate ABC transporter substrate-binding/OmpA family protein [Rheinheimera sp.]
MNHARPAMVLFLLGAIAIGGYYLFKEQHLENAFKASSDASGAKDRIRIAVDSWVGYYPLCSAELKKRLRELGYALECVDDGADYPARMKQLQQGDIDFAVATVDSYVVAGAAVRYPGVIVSVIDESKGGDAIIARKARFASLDDLKSGNIKVALTPSSPSEFLAKSLAVHFDLPPLARSQPWLVATEGSAQALQALQQGKVDAAVLWEPDVSRALQDPQFHRLIGTEQTERMVVDVLVAQRELVAKKPELVSVFLQQYFRVLKRYRDEPQLLQQELVLHTGLAAADVANMVKGVAWASLTDNALTWMAHDAKVPSKEAAISSIESVISVLTDYGDLTRNPLPDADPYRLLNSSFVHQLYQQSSSGFTGAVDTLPQAQQSYAALTNAQWQNMREVGTLKLRAINFSSGSDVLSLDDKTRLDDIAATLSHYPHFYIDIRGHSGVRGDPAANRQLSQDRADAVARYLELTHNFAGNRMRTLGVGGEQPLVRQPGETERSYFYRLPRVELIFLTEQL